MSDLAEWLRAMLAEKKRSLPAHSHRFSPKKFTDPQLAVLVDLHFWAADWYWIQRDPRFSSEDQRKLSELRGRILPASLLDLGEISWRGIVKLLKECAELREALELKSVPHYSTLAHAANRLAEI